jgi:hypothetical protein
VQEREQRHPDAEAEGDVEDEQRALGRALIFPKFEQALDRLELADEGAMREHRALRHAGRARGEDDERSAVEDRARRRRGLRKDIE